MRVTRGGRCWYSEVATTHPSPRKYLYLFRLFSKIWIQLNPALSSRLDVKARGKIALLDSMVHHQEDGRLTTTVNWKPTHTARYLSFSSHHPCMHKQDVVKPLTDRAAKIPTTKSDQIKEKQRVISTLQSNGYPKRFILDASKPKPPLQNLSGDTAQFHTSPGPPINKESFRKPWLQSGFQTLSDLARFFQSRNTKWTKKKLMIPFTTFLALIAAKIRLAKRRENS